MGKIIKYLKFRLMVLLFVIRDCLRPRSEVLKEVGIKPGFSVLDYGCGTGSYILESSTLAGNHGTVYALDINPLSVAAAKRIALRYNLPNVRTILSDCVTGLPDRSVDVVLLYDILHDLKNYNSVLDELHRILKPEGILSVSDHHLSNSNIVSRIVSSKKFRLTTKGQITHSFVGNRNIDKK